MTAHEVLVRLRALEIRVLLEGAGVRVIAPKGVLNEDIWNELRTHKDEIHKLLAHAREAGKALPRIVRVERSRRLPLSYAQQRLWFLSQMEGVSEAYHIPFGLCLKGELERVALRRALNRIVERHEALRTTFISVDGEAEQRIAAVEGSYFDLQEQDVRGRDDAKEELERLVTAEANTAFDLEAGPLIRGRLIQLAEDEHVLLVTMHHIVSDGWSMGVMFNELSVLYGVFLRGEADPLPELEVQYADYAVWQREWMEGEILREQGEYWRKTLAGAPAVLEVAGDHVRPAEQDFAGAFARLELDAKLTEGLKELSRKHGATLYMTLLAGWAAMLGRLSGQQDVVIGTPVANRGRSEIEGLIGFFVNTLALRLDLTGSPTVGEFLERVKEQALAAQEHQDIPFEQVVELVRPVRSLSHSPVFQVMFAWGNAPGGKLELSGLRLKPVQAAPQAFAKFDLTLLLEESGEGIVGGVEYATALFERSTIERYLEYFRRLLEGMVADEMEVMDRLALLDVAERQQIVQGWNETGVEYAQKCVHELFEEQVERSPEAVAVVFEGEQLTYGELNRRANRLGHYLRRLGIRPDERVAICVERGLEMVVGLMGILKAGGAYVPLDPAYPEERLRFMMEDSAPAVLLTQGHLKELFRGMREIPVLDIGEGSPAWRSEAETNPAGADVGLTRKHLAYIIYTSGSTGRPKGVAVEHGELQNALVCGWKSFGVCQQDVMAAVASSAFDISLLELITPWLAGACNVVLSRMEILDVELLVDRLRGVTILHAVPSLMRQVIGVLKSRGKERDAVRLRSLWTGGDKVAAELLGEMREVFPDSEIWVLYGPTETTIICADELAIGRRSVSPIGRPIANTRIYILDSYGEPVPVGVGGELYIGGVGVARGYWKRPELTAEKFIADPFSGEAGTRMYKTGDVGRWLADGSIEFLGRNDEQVKIRGYRIELGEIEAALVSHRGVREAVVVAREDEPGEKRLVAYYTAEGEGAGAEELRGHLSAKLPEYMVPAAYVKLERLPLTVNGKLDRKGLPAPGGDAYGVQEYEEPRGETEKKLAEIWAEVLKVERVGRQDNFFELGGHSLLAVRMVSRVRQVLGVEVTIRDLFAHSRLRDLARDIESATPTTVPLITRVERSRRLPLSYAQQRLWFLSQMEGVSEAYHIPFGLCLKGELERVALRRALNRIVERHEALRTTFISVDGEAEQRIAAVEGSYFDLQEQDVRGRDDAKEELERLVTAEANTAFDLEAGPLIRGRLIQLAEDEHVLLVTMHHIVSDGWSMGVMFNELSVLYGVFLRGEADPLPELEVQYADYAVWQREWMEGEILREQGEYWRKTLAGAPAVLEVAGDHVRPAEQDFAGAFARLELDAKLTEGLKELSRKHGATLYMTLLAGWAAMLGRLSGQQDVVIGTSVANRGRSEIEGLIGFFVNTLALRLDLTGSPTVGEFLERVKEQALAAQEHQDIPFEQVVELVRPVRSLSHSPVFQVMFAWGNAPGGKLELSGLELRPLPLPHIMSRFDLTLTLEEAGEGIVGGVEYATALFERSTIERYLEYFRRLLEGMVADEMEVMDRLALLDVAERQQIVQGWNETGVEYAQKCVHELFEEQVERSPEAVAVVFEGEQLTYGELNRRANRLGHYLRRLGIRPDERVAICVERGLEMVVGLMGILKAGGAYVPLDPAYPEERLRFMMEDSAPAVLLTQGHLKELFRGMREIPVLDIGEGSPAWRSEAETNPAGADVGLTRKHLAYIIYTSGSTGRPKGVAVEHVALCNYLMWAISTYPSRNGIVSSSFSFDATVTSLYTPLLCGKMVRVLREWEEIDGLYSLIHSEVCGLVKITPTQLDVIGRKEYSEVTHNTSVGVFVIGGEALSPSIICLWRQIQLDVRLVNEYGPTETVVGCAVYDVPLQIDLAKTVPIGRPIANTRIYILDSYGEPVPVGVSGEIHIGGVQVARGYWKRLELTAEKFIADPFSGEAGTRMYKTGDVGRWLADGSIEFLGRNDEQVKIRGYRIELGEIEAALVSHRGVREAVVVAREDEPGEKRLVAYYTAEGEGAGAEELRGHLSAKLPEYMVPAAYVKLERLPLTVNGKLDRKGLPAPGGDAYGVQEYEEPRGETEKKLAEIWAEVLKVERVGRQDNFFELGGHSLLAVTLIERMRQEKLQAEVDVRALFAKPTLAELAATVDGAVKVEVPANKIPEGCEAIRPEMLPLVSLTQEEIDCIVGSVPGGVRNIQDIYPLAPLQEGILFHHLMGGEGDPYLLANLTSFDSRARLEAYVNALQGVIDRHDILRTGVAWEGLREPVQVVWRKAVLQVEEVKLGLGDSGEQLYGRFNPRHYRIDVRHAPLLRVYIAHDEEKERWLMMELLHHLAGDHTTLEVMQEEVQAYLLGQSERLPKLQPFRNLVAQARLGVSREEHEEFFRELLGDVEEPTAPFGLIDVQGDGTGIEEARILLDSELARRIRERARKLGVSAASVCHLAWAQVLARVSGRKDVVFGTVLFGRMQGGAGADRVMGLFINTLPVRIRVGEEGVEASVRGTHRQLAELLRHEHASLALAQRCSGVVAPRPLFSAMLNYRHIGSATQILPAEARRAWEGMEWLRGEERTNYPLTLSVDDLGEGFGLTAQVEASIDPKRVCEFMRRALESLVEALERAPAKAVSTIDVLPEEERQQVLYEWNETGAEYAQKCVHELFEEQVERSPEAVAVVFEGEQLTYGELNRRANRLGHYLRRLGIRPDERVAICVERGLEMVVGLMGILKAGGAYVPLDPAYPEERLRFMMEDSAPAVLLTQGHLKELFRGMREIPVLDIGEGSPAWRSEAETNPAGADVGLTRKHLAYIIYTSGSTGTAKGVTVEHCGVVNVLGHGRKSFEIGNRDAMASLASFAFDISLLELMTPWLAGACSVILSRMEILDAKLLISRLRELTILGAVPSLMRQVIGVLKSRGKERDAVRLRSLWTGGDKVAAELLGEMREVFPDSEIWVLYGPTETTIICADELAIGRRSVSPIGRPIANTRIYILDSYGEPVPVGVGGELYIGGVGVARGYWKRPELTAEKFIADPFSGEAGTRMYKTGDVGRWLADGSIEFLGRNDEQVKIRGYRIELGEIEAALVSHRGVREAVVVAREDEPGEKRLVAYYTAEGEGAGAEELRGHLSAKLPEYMVPAAYVKLERLPLTVNGKLDRKGLPAPGGDAYGVQEYEEPRGETEKKLAEIWAEVLKVERVGRQDNFFELGGHSLLAVRMVSRVRQVLGVEVTIRDLFAHSRLRDLARDIESATPTTVPLITRVERSRRLPLSYAQQRLWFLSQMEGVSEAYHIPFGLCLKGELERVALRRALNRIVERHEALRTTFISVDGEAEQRIAAVEGSYFDLQEQDVRGRDDAKEELERLVTAEANTAFDLEAGPLIRGRLIQLAEDEHVLLVTMHHIVSDGWSMGVMFNELSVLYGVFLRGEADPLPELEVQYADYAVWQREWMEGEILREQGEYWRKTLAGAPAVLEVAGDHVRPAEQDFAGAFARLELDAKLTEGLKELSRKHGATLYMTLLAGWAAMLGRLSGQQDVVIGTPVANRGRSEIEGLIGFFVNTLALRLDLTGSPTVGEFLERVKEQALAAQEHQDIPFEQVVELVRPVRSLSHSPVFQVMFAWGNAPGGKLELSGLELRPLPLPHIMSRFDLTLTLEEAGEGIVGGVEYATALFERSTIERYLEYFRRLLEGMVADEMEVMDRLALLDVAERQQIVQGWNETGVEYAQKCVHELFEEQVERSPEAVAVVFEGEQLTYGELNRRANRLGHYLRRLGIRPDERVAICVERGLEMVVGLMGILKAGGAYVPLDPAYPEERLRFMMEDSAPAVLLTQGHLKELFRGMREIPVLDIGEGSPAWRSEAETNPAGADVGLTRKHLAYIIYTSGSTGRPKGVMNEHRGLVNRLIWMQYAYKFDWHDAVLQKTPFSFDVSVWEFFWPLLVGARLVMARAEGHKDPAYLVEAIRHNNITTVHFVPSMLQAFLEQADEADCATLERVICSGEALPVMLVRRFQGQLSSVALQNLYGPTEAAVDVTAWTCRPDISRTRIPIGRPIANTRIYILDSYGEPVPVGVSGEIHIGGVQVARGYWKRPELTAEKFIADPFSGEAGTRMYKTGDVGRWLADGSIEFLGRNDEQVKIRGYRIELGEIEAALVSHRGVREAVVVAREDEPGEKRLVAYYTAEGEGAGAEELRGHLSAKLPEYMVPAAYVKLERLPLTVNGKLDRKGLPAPGGDAYGVQEYEEPRGETEKKLAEIWAEVLKVERVGRQDNFFELGGHSLLAVTLIERMRRSGLQVDVRALFAKPTLAELAATVDGAVKVEVPANKIPEGCEAIRPEMLPLVSLTQEEIDCIVGSVPGGVRNIQDIYPLAPLQEGILFHHLMGGEGDPYLLANLTSFDSRARLEAYVNALQGVIDRHDILRTGVAWEGLREPVQVVWRKAVLQVEEVKLGLGDSGEQLYGRFNPRHYRIDVRHAPLLRVYIAHDEEKERWLMMELLHHLAGDHTTLEVMQEEVQAYLLGQSERLPKLQPFRNLVAQARLGVSREEHEEFFRELLGDVEEPTAPFGLIDVQGDGTGIEEARILLDSELARRIRERARKLGVSAASVCHLAWAQVLARVSGRKDVVFGTVLFGRMQGGAGADRVMGLFINTLPVRIRVGEEGVEASVRGTHRQLAELLRHEHASLALAQRCSGVVAPRPLFSAMLNYRHIGSATQILPAEARRAWEGMEWLRGEERTNYPLTLSVDDLGEGFGLTAQVEASIDPKRVCEFMRRALESLVEALERAPAKAVSTIDVLPEEERQQVLYEWNETGAEYAQKCVHELFEEQVERSPEAVAVVFEGEQLTYGELNRRANRLGHYLRRLGIRPGGRIVTLLERSIELVVAELAILKCGAVYVPIDPTFPADRKIFMITDSEAETVCSIEGMQIPEMPGLTRVNVDRIVPVEGKADDLDVPVDSEAIAYIMYTSGSTGQPKGVLVPHQAINQLVLNNGYIEFKTSDRVAFAANPAFDAATMEVWAPLLQGGCIIVISKDELLSPAILTRKIRQNNISILFLTTALFNQIARDASEAFIGMRYLLFGGEQAEPRWVKQVLDKGRPQHLLHAYGPTEAITFSTIYEVNTVPENARSIAIGRPISNTRVYILDSCGEPAPIGVAGEIHIGGTGLACGYLNQMALTAERFIADPFSGEAGTRMYKTGDVGRWLADGSIEFLGRNDEQVKIRGYRIELGEIEAALVSHRGVREAVVMAREDEPGEKRLVAYYTAEGEGAGAEELRGHLSAKLPEYMVPIAYVRLQKIPLTSNGKLDRKALPRPDVSLATSDRWLRTPDEMLLCSLFAETLGVANVEPDDSFFSLGGHSLLATRLVNSIQKALGVQISVRTLFEAPTVSKLITLKDLRADSNPFEIVLPIRARGNDLPLFFVHPGAGLSWCYAGLLKYIDAERPMYGLQARNFNSSNLAAQTIEEMAAEYAEKLYEIQPTGPYSLVGWSSGGLIAHSIATMLQNRGERIAFLCILDATPLSADEMKAAEPHTSPSVLDLAIALFDVYLKSEEPTLSAYYDCLQRRGQLPVDFSQHHFAALMENFKYAPNLRRAFRPKVYNGDVVLFVSTLDGCGEAASEIWRPYVNGNIRVHSVSCEHAAMMSSTPLAEIGPELANELGNA